MRVFVCVFVYECMCACVCVNIAIINGFQGYVCVVCVFVCGGVSDSVNVSISMHGRLAYMALYSCSVFLNNLLPLLLSKNLFPSLHLLGTIKICQNSLGTSLECVCVRVCGACRRYSLK